MKDQPYLLDATRRDIALAAVHHVCQHCKWNLRAAHIRQTHGHIIVVADQLPGRVMITFKSNISSALNQHEPDCRRWTRHGSTRYLWTNQQLAAAVNYVISKQGEPMACWAAPDARSTI